VHAIFQEGEQRLPLVLGMLIITFDPLPFWLCIMLTDAHEMSCKRVLLAICKGTLRFLKLCKKDFSCCLTAEYDAVGEERVALQSKIEAATSALAGGNICA